MGFKLLQSKTTAVPAMEKRLSSKLIQIQLHCMKRLIVMRQERERLASIAAAPVPVSTQVKRTSCLPLSMTVIPRFEKTILQSKHLIHRHFFSSIDTFLVGNEHASSMKEEANVKQVFINGLKHATIQEIQRSMPDKTTDEIKKLLQMYQQVDWF